MLTNWNTLDFDSCGSTLRANHVATTLIGGLGAGSGVLAFGWCMMSGWSTPSLLTLLAWPLVVLTASTRFTKLIPITIHTNHGPINKATQTGVSYASTADRSNR